MLYIGSCMETMLIIKIHGMVHYLLNIEFPFQGCKKLYIYKVECIQRRFNASYR